LLLQQVNLVADAFVNHPGCSRVGACVPRVQ
jgi:hypothetical protein